MYKGSEELLAQREVDEMREEGLEPIGHPEYIHVLDISYLVIPKRYLRDYNINANEEKLLAIIDLLSKKKGYCWSRNRNLAKAMKITKGALANMLGRLKEKGYIHQEWDGEERRIFIKK